METVIISACLVGDKVRYDGKGKYNPLVKEILTKFELLPLCPEVMGGLGIPRIPSEIRSGVVINKEGEDVTHYFKEGARKCMNPISYKHCTKAILTDRSPSCGVHEIHNGRFDGGLLKGEGIFTKFLKEHNIEVYTIEEFYEEFIKNK